MTLALLGWILGIVVVLLVLILVVWWLRARNAPAVRSFQHAVRQMEREQGVSDRYQTPWMLMVGDDAHSAQLCASWNLSPVGNPAWFGRWWADPEGAVLVVPQSLFVPDASVKAQGSGWATLLGLLLRVKGRRALDAVIWNISASDLLDSDQAIALGIAVRRRFVDLLQRTGLALPVYVVVNGMDDVPGFQDLIAALPQDARQQMLGWSSPYEPNAVWESRWSDIAVDEVTQALSEAVIQIGALSGQLSADLSFLPERVQALRRNVQMLLEPVFQGNAHSEAMRLRGLYFTARQAGAAEHTSLSALDGPATQIAFGEALWQRRINAERGLAQPVPRLLQLRRRWQRVTAGVALALGVVWAIGMLWVWHDFSEDADKLSRLVQNTQGGYIVINDETQRLESTRRNVKAFWQMLATAPRWHYASIVFPTSWFSSRNTDMEGVLQHVADTHLRQPLHDLLAAQLRDVQAITDSERRNGVQGDDPGQWSSYLKARELVEKATRLEQMNALYAAALADQSKPLEQWMQLSNAQLGLNLNMATLPREGFYNRLLAKEGSAPGAVDLTVYRKEVSDNFNQLMDKWLGQYFRADGFIASAGYLRLHLQRLESSADTSLEEIERINDLIDDLQAVVDMTNSIWSRGKGQDLVQGYQALLEAVRQSSLLGAPVAPRLETQAAQLQYSFKDQWVSQDAASNSLLTQGANGHLSLQDRVSELRSAIVFLLKRDFVASALLVPDSSVSFSDAALHVDDEGLALALSYYDSYKRYAQEELTKIPAAYRAALLKTAELTTAKSMWLSMGDQAPDALRSDDQPFDIKAGQALAVNKAFQDLKRPQMAISLQNYLNRLALSDIAIATREILEQPLFRDRADINQWEGERNFGLQLLRASDPQDLKRGLDLQFSTISSITEQHAPAVEWLKTQQRNLLMTDVEGLARFDAMSENMAQYKAQNPSSSPAAITRLLSHDFNEMDTNTCLGILQSASAPVSTGELTQRWLDLQQAALRRCQSLQQGQATGAWNELAGYFNQYLSGRFPFADSLQASDADPARVQYFLTLIDSRLAQAQEGLKASSVRDRAAASEFLERLRLARPWLGALLIRDKAGLLGADMEVRWRTDRDSERGADQVINWKLIAGNQTISYPGDTPNVLHWTVGQPVSLILRWARDGTQRPVNDPLQPDLRVGGLEAEWQYIGPWSLLRLMSAHVSMQRQPNMDYTEFPLSLEVPVHAPANEGNQTLMFVRLSLMSQGSKAPLSIQPLPTLAPRSPFGSAPRSVAAMEVKP
ncbi:type VI secretion protein IcmF/TssM N-terminal domain-containing protein [Pseudomonas syringae USA007]|uniref:Type VI secretion protein IcmF/TssM N-terminal domain-containing protein n=2 Tax=Pseudomonas syringae TaxID=317 RepID=A0AAU8M2W6_PSESX|nr:type VI secretion protein IcmF/TssM N-terminal domain-containing protein [Pseudomonas syringae]